MNADISFRVTSCAMGGGGGEGVARDGCTKVWGKSPSEDFVLKWAATEARLDAC